MLILQRVAKSREIDVLMTCLETKHRGYRESGNRVGANYLLSLKKRLTSSAHSSAIMPPVTCVRGWRALGANRQ